MRPAPDPTIRLARPSLGQDELEAIAAVFESGQLTNGPATRRFEDLFAQRHEVEHAVALANGTVALAAMLLAFDIGPGDEVIVPSFTFISTATSVLHVGARPVFAEIDAVTFNVDPTDVARRITASTKAIIAVHYGGQPADMDELGAIADDAGVVLLEDAAEAHGASYRGRPVGGLGAAAIFSFTPTKNLTTGEGGMFTTDDAGVADRVRLLRNHGQTSPYLHESVGYNWRISDIQAAVGAVQVGKLDEILARKRQLATAMSSALGPISGVRPPAVGEDRDHVFMLYTITVDGDRDGLAQALGEAGIESRVYFPPAHLQPAFSGKPGSLPVTERVADRVLSIPLHPYLTDDEVTRIATAVAAAT